MALLRILLIAISLAAAACSVPAACAPGQNGTACPKPASGPSISTAGGVVKFAAKDVHFAVADVAAPVSIAALVGQINALPTTSQMEAAVGAETKAAKAARTALKAKIMQDVGVLTGDLETKVTAKVGVVDKRVDVVVASVVTLKKKVEDLTTTIGKVKEQAPSAHWVGAAVVQGCTGGTTSEQAAKLVLGGFGFAPGRKYTLQLASADGKHKRTSKLVATIPGSMEPLTKLAFDLPTLIKEWGNAKVTKATVTLVADGKVVLAFTGVAGGNVATMALPKDEAKVCSSVKVGHCGGKTGSKEEPVANCREFKKQCGDVKSGTYWMTMGGKFKSGIQAHCDMDTDGGGWTLFASRQGRGAWVPHSKYQSKCHNVRGGDCFNLVPDTEAAKATDVMFRFYKTDNENKDGSGRALTFLGWKRNTPSNTYNDRFWNDNFKNGHRGCGDPGGKRVCGFYKGQEWVNKGKRQQSSTCVNLMHWCNGGTISERHQKSSGGSDQWIDMWNSVDGDGNNYRKVLGSGNPRGMKCIAAVCHMQDPINLYFK